MRIFASHTRTLSAFTVFALAAPASGVGMWRGGMLYIFS